MLVVHCSQRQLSDVSPSNRDVTCDRCPPRDLLLTTVNIHQQTLTKTPQWQLAFVLLINYFLNVFNLRSKSQQLTRHCKGCCAMSRDQSDVTLPRCCDVIVTRKQTTRTATWWRRRAMTSLMTSRLIADESSINRNGRSCVADVVDRCSRSQQTNKHTTAPRAATGSNSLWNAVRRIIVDAAIKYLAQRQR